MTLSTFFYGAAVGFYQYILPLYMTSLGATPDQVGLGLALGNSGSIVGLVVGGTLVNRFGLRFQIIVSWLITLLSAVVFYLAQSWEMVSFALFLTAISLIGIPAYNAYIVIAREGQETTQAVTFVYVGFTIGSALTPALSGWIIAGSSMRAAFLASLVCTLASTIVILPLRERWTHAEDGAAEVTTSRGLRRILDPLRAYGESLANPSFRRLLTILVGLYIATYVGVALLPNYLHERLGMDPSTVALLGTGSAIVGVIGSLSLARLAGRIGQFRALAIAESLLCVGFGIVLLAPTLGSLAIAAGAVGFALRGSVQAQSAVAQATVASVADGPRLGPSFALQSIAFNAALTLGPALAGLLYTSDPRLPIALALVVGIPITLYLALQPRARTSAQRKQSTV